MSVSDAEYITALENVGDKMEAKINELVKAMAQMSCKYDALYFKHQALQNTVKELETKNKKLRAEVKELREWKDDPRGQDW